MEHSLHCNNSFYNTLSSYFLTAGQPLGVHRIRKDIADNVKKYEDYLGVFIEDFEEYVRLKSTDAVRADFVAFYTSNRIYNLTYFI